MSIQNKNTASISQTTWIDAKNPSKDHAYLITKKINPFNIKQDGNNLIIPLINKDNIIINIQSISPTGHKLFTKGAPTKGNFHIIEGDVSKPIYITEGYATSATIHMITNATCITAFGANNMFDVCKNIIALYPSRKIIIAADNDHTKPKNTGIVKAEEISIKLNLPYVMPIFDPQDMGTDFNDLMISKGTEQTKQCLENIIIPDNNKILHNKIIELASLSRIEYDQVRKEEANKLGIRVSKLDEAIKEEQEASLASSEQQPVFAIDEPPSEYQTNGEELADQIYETFDRYLIAPRATLIALTLWTIASYNIDNFKIFPKLCINSPTKRCGKTTCLEVLSSLARKPLSASNATVSAIFRSIDLYQPTILFDEAETFTKNNEELRGIINAGHQKSSAFLLRTVGEKSKFAPKQFSLWTPMVIAMIGNPPSTIADRSIFIELKRKWVNEKKDKVPLNLRDICKNLRSKIIRWSSDYSKDIKTSNIQLPNISSDRAIDNWLPLLSIANLIGEKWYKLAYDSCKELNINTNQDEDIGIQLLFDIKIILQELNLENIHSNDLVNKLIEIEESPYNDINHGRWITASWLAKQLRPFSISSKQIKINGINKKGYSKNMFTESWDRYIPKTLNNNETNDTESTQLISKEFLDKKPKNDENYQGLPDKSMEDTSLPST